MDFKRKIIGYHRGQIDEMLAEQSQAISLEIQKRDQLIQALNDEGKELEKQYDGFSRLLEKAEKRHELLTSYAKIMETFFQLTQRQVEEQADKLLGNAAKTAQETKLNTEKIAQDTKSLLGIVDDVHDRMVQQAAATQDILSANTQDLETLTKLYLPGKEDHHFPDHWASAYVEKEAGELYWLDRSDQSGNDRIPLQIVKTAPVPPPDAYVEERPHNNRSWEALIIDDDPTILSVVRALLEREGIQVTEALDGRDATALIDSITPPSIVIMDIMLPYVGGLQLVTRIRSMDNWGKTPIIMLTSNSSENEIVRLLEAGANDYMLKPFNTKELVARVKRLLDSNAKAL